LSRVQTDTTGIIVHCVLLRSGDRDLGEPPWHWRSRSAALRAGGAPHVVAAAQAPLSALAAHPALPFELWSGDVAGGVAAWDLRGPGRL
jgi:hypothetical protein